MRTDVADPRGDFVSKSGEGTEERLRRSHETFYHLIQNNPFGVYVVDADFRLREVSRGARKVFENVRPLLGRDFAEVLRVIWDEPFASEAIGRFRHTLGTGEPYEATRTVERRHDIADVEAYDWRIDRVTLPDGRFGVVCYFYDLSERQRWEAALSASEARQSAALAVANLGTFEWELGSGVVTLDERSRQIFGFAPGEGKRQEEVFGRIDPADLPRVQAQAMASARDLSRLDVEYRIVLPSGGTRTVISISDAVAGRDGKAERMFGVFGDVTERRRGERLLAAQNRALELVATGAPLPEALGALARVVEEQSGGQVVAAILLVEDDGLTLRTGAAPSLPPEYCAAIDGIKAKEGLGTCADAAARNVVVVTEDLASAESWRGLAHLPLALGLKAAWSMPICSSEGRVLGTFGTYFRECRGPTAWERQIVEGLSRAAALAIERKRAEEALREGEERLRMAVAIAEMGTFQIDLLTDAVTVNETGRAIYGWTAGEPLTFSKVQAHFHPDDKAEVMRRVGEAFVADGPGEFEVEQRIVRTDGAMRWLRVRGRALFEEVGESRRAVRCVGTYLDVTDQKEAEARREELLASERAARSEAERANAAKSEFLATLSHELRTPLTPVLLTVSLMEHHPALADELREDVATIRRNVELESRLISDLLDLTRIERGKMQLDEADVDLHLIVRSAADICQREASAKLTLDLRASHHTVRGDATRLQQVFWNLINNAIKFTPQEGTIAVRSMDAGEGRIRVEVADTGSGIDAAVLPKIFDAFEQGESRVARQQAGLGLGLAISKKLVEAHGGTITAASPGRGRGATFSVELPATRSRVAATARPRPEALPTVGRALGILLVEDHEQTLAVMSRLLRGMGHRVTGVTTVASATAAVAQDVFDLIISDLGLPDGSGLDVMRSMRERYAGRAIALTGYGMESDVAASREAGFAEHLTKPVDLAGLASAIRRVTAALE